MYIFKKKIDKKKLIRYGLYLLFFILLAVVVSFCAIWIKYKIVEYEVLHKEPGQREYSMYYNSLNYKEQLLYDSIVSTADDLSEESEVLQYYYSMEDFQKILQYIRADRAELFYVDFNSLVLYHSSNDRKTKVGMVYHGSKAEVTEMIKKYESTVDSIMQGITSDMSDFEKELYINDYLTANCDYALGEDVPFASTAYGALVEGEAYCDGYAYAAKQLLNKAFIDSVVIYGSTDNEEHVWNLIELDGAYYHLDVMWNDANIGTDNKLRFHGYFNLSDEQIRADHDYDNKGFIPYSPIENNYYRAIGSFAETTDALEDIFYRQLKKAVEEKKEYIELLCPQTKDNKVISKPYVAALKRVNEELGYEALYEAFSVYEASAQNNSVTIQIFYN